MWRMTKKASSKKFSFLTNASKLSKPSNFLEKFRPTETQTRLNSAHLVSILQQVSAFPCQPEKWRDPSCRIRTISFGASPFLKGHSYATAAAQAIVSTDESDHSGPDDLQELIEEMNTHNQKMESQLRPQPKKTVFGIGAARYGMLKKRQIKMETEAWEEASREYREMLTDMCEQKLAPNLPYMKSLFLGWFEPFRDAIVAEQELCKKLHKLSHRPYFDQLPAEMMAVITMHKLMGLLMTINGANASVRVVQAACAVGEAIEQEARIHNFLEKTKKKSEKGKKHIIGSDDATSEEEKVDKEKANLRRKVTLLMKKQKLQQVRGIVKSQDNSLPWGQEAHVKEVQ